MDDRLHHKVIETMNDGFGILDENGFITFANEKICQMMGSSREEIVGRHVTDYIDPGDVRTFQEKFRDNRQGIFYAFELTCRRADGTKIFTTVSPGPIVDDQGNFKGGFAIVTDVTERRKTEEALKESEERFRTMFDHAFDGILLADPEGKRLIMGNRAICEMLGYSRKELESMKIYDIHPREHLAEVLDQFERMESGELTVACDVPLKNRNGTILYADISGSHFTIGGERYLMGIFRDITTRRRNEEQRKQRNEQLESLVLERTEQIEAVVAELESEIIERRQAESLLLQRRADIQEVYDGIVQSLTQLQTSLRNLVYVPAEDIMFKLGDLHMLVDEILERLRKASLTPP